MDCKRCINDSDDVASGTKPGTKQAKIDIHNLLGVKAEVSDFEQKKDGCCHFLHCLPSKNLSKLDKNFARQGKARQISLCPHFV
jgi:hypothetical protein